MTAKKAVLRRTETEFRVQSLADDYETEGSYCTHKVGDKNCDGCKDGQGQLRQEHCGRVMELIVKNGKKQNEKRCDGRVHVTRFCHGDRAYWIEVIKVCDKCGEVTGGSE